MDDLNIPEGVRQKIDELIEQSSKNLHMPEPIRHMLTSICFLLYSHGWRDAHRYMNKAIEISKNTFTK